MDYLDFELEITTGSDGGYATRVLHSPAGEATGSMDFPLDTLALENRLQSLQLALLKSGKGRRRIELPETRLVKQFGGELWNALFSGDIVNRFDVSRSKARAREKGLRIKLRVTPPELAVLPWEFLYDARRGAFLALSATTPLVRYTALTEPIEPLAIVPPIRVLGMIADPIDLAPLDVAREKERLERALGRLIEHGFVELRWVPNGTWRDLHDALRHGPWHIFHFIGHGGFDGTSREGVLALVDENQKAHLLSATELGILLGDQEALRLAVLNSCDSARAEETDVFSSTAASLVKQGTPAVVAMQYEITDLAAIEFSRLFYEAIADGVPVDSAVSEARKGIAVSISGTLEWGTPVLHTRAPDGVLFTIAPEHAASTAIDRSTGAIGATADLSEPRAAAGVHGIAGLVGPATTVTTGSRSAVLDWVGGWARSWRVLPIGLVVVAIAIVLVAVLSPPRPVVPLMTLSAAEAAIGDTIRVSGSGYQAGETVQITMGGVLLGAVTADTNGAFSVPLLMPVIAGSGMVLEARGTSSGRMSSGSVAVRTAAASIGPAPADPLDSGGAPSGDPIASASPMPSAGPSQRPTVPPATAKPVTPRPVTPRPPAQTPPPTPAPTHTIVVNRSIVLVPTGELDVDSGVVRSSGADVWFQQPAVGENYVVPELGGKISFFGAAAPSYTQCKNAPVSTSPVPIGASNVGSYVCVRTGGGLVGRLLIEALSDTLQLRVQRWS